MKNTWLKCSKCARKIRKKTYQSSGDRGVIAIVCVQCNLKLVKKRKNDDVKNKEDSGYTRKQY